MIAALQERLIAAQRNGFLDLLVDDLARQHVGAGVAGLAVERTEVADRGADVGVVDIAVDVVGAIRLGVQASADGVGGAAQKRQVAASEEREALVGRQPLSLDGFVQDVVDVHGIIPPRY
jgi:hypothetical protein